MDAIRRNPLALALAALLVVFALAAGSLLMPQSVDALPADGTHIDYYNNASCDVQVGFRYYNCEGQLESSWGVTSPYYVSNTYGCQIER